MSTNETSLWMQALHKHSSLGNVSWLSCEDCLIDFALAPFVDDLSS